MKKKIFVLSLCLLLPIVLWAASTALPEFNNAFTRSPSTGDTFYRLYPKASWPANNSKWYAYVIAAASTTFETVPIYTDGYTYAQFQVIPIGIPTYAETAASDAILTKGAWRKATLATPFTDYSAIGGVHGMRGTPWYSTFSASGAVASASWIQDNTTALMFPLAGTIIGADTIASATTYNISGLARVSVYGSTGLTYTCNLGQATATNVVIRGATRLLLLGIGK